MARGPAERREDWLMHGLLLAAVALLVGANAFFVAAEFALVSIRRSRVEELVAGGSRAARAVLRAQDDLDRYIAGTQIGITLASLGLGWIGEPALARLFTPWMAWLPGVASPIAAHGVAVGVAFAAITVLHVVLGELVPKSLALQRTEATALRLAWAMGWVVRLLRPMIWSLNGAGNLVLRLLGLQGGAVHQSVHSVEELAILAGQSRAAGVIDRQELELVTRGLRFGDHVAREAMVPRPDVVALDVAEPVPALIRKAAAARHTRLPLYTGSLDQIVGVLNVGRLLPPLVEGTPPADLRAFVRPAVFVPDVMRLDDVMRRLRQEHAELAVVVDEYGGTAGIITLRDLVEEVFGSLDAADDPVRRDPDGMVRIRGDARLDEVNRALGWRLADPDTDTIGGYVLARLGRPARPGDVCEIGGAKVRVEAMQHLRITQLALRPPGSTVQGDAPPAPSAGTGAPRPT